MVPFSCRLFVQVASLLVPGAKRGEWKREWNAELWHRAEAGALPDELLRRASGVFRDAAWIRQSERKRTGTDLFRHPLRVEAVFLAFAVLLALCLGAFRAPKLPYDQADRLVTVERNLPYMGSDVWISPRFIELSKRGPFSGVAAFRVIRTPVLGMLVARNFFDVLSAKPKLGRTFTASDPENVVVLPYGIWRSELHSDPRAIGKHAIIEAKPYTIIGVMNKDFWFRSNRIRFFTPFQRKTAPAGMLARLKPGLSLPEAQTQARAISRNAEPDWLNRAMYLQPLLEDRRIGDVWTALKIAALGAVLGMAYLILKRRGKWRYWLMLGARIMLVVTAISMLPLAFQRRPSSVPVSWELFAFWIFLLLCSAAVCLLVIDHRERCHVCLRLLRKPVSIGSWASQILDQPSTEYLCPAGHGTLCVAETGNAEDHWTTLDESWQEFFAHTER